MSNNRVDLCFISCLREDNTYYFVPTKYNFIAKYESQTDKTSIVSWLNNSFSTVVNQYGKIFRWNERLICIPNHAKQFAIADENSHKTWYVDIPRIENSKIGYSFFGDGLQIGKYVYAVGNSYEGFVKIDCETLETTVLDEWRKCARWCDLSQSSFLQIRKQVCDSKVFMIGNNPHGLLEYDFLSGEYLFKSIKDSIDYISGFIVLNQSLWVVTDNDVLLELDLQNMNVIRKIDLDTKETARFQYLFAYGPNIYMCAPNERMMFMLNTSDMSTFSSEFPREYESNPYISQLKQDTILFSSDEIDYMVCFDMKKRCFRNRRISLLPSEQDLRSYMKNSGNRPLNEGFWACETLLDFVVGI